MPNFHPEGTQAATGDDEARSYKKWNEQLFNTYGNIGRVPFPEGTYPSAGDDAERSAKKIDAIYQALADNTNLLSGLVGYWKLEEASGNREDSTGRGNNLSPTNTPTNATGKLGNAANFVAASSQYLSRGDNADLKFNGDFTVACWVYLDTNTSEMAAVSKYGFTGGAMDNFILSYDQGTDRFRGYLGAGDSATFVLVYADNYGPVPTGQWVFVVCWRGGNNFYISVNNGAANSTSAAVIPTTLAGTADFNISGVQDSATIYWDGRIDEVGKWNRALTENERAKLYRGGAGLSYNF